MNEEGQGAEFLGPGAGAEPIPGYRLVRPLGRGGFGEVWEARAPGGLRVALKFVRLRDDPGGIEARALEVVKEVRHPNLLAQFGAWRLGQYLAIGMELADGSLSDRLASAQAAGASGLPFEELVGYMEESAKGIDHLNGHKHTLGKKSAVGVQHRDIKPQNILLVGGGVKVADFGLARILEGKTTGHTGSMTPAYAAPEFFRNRTSDRSDQYSLAVVYCQLRAGRLPFEGGLEAVMAGHLLRSPNLSMLPPSEQPSVARALAKEPEDRWPSCGAFIAALREGVKAAATEPVSTKVLTLPADDPPETLLSHSINPSQRNARSTGIAAASRGIRFPRRLARTTAILSLAALLGLFVRTMGGRRQPLPVRAEVERDTMPTVPRERSSADGGPGQPHQGN